MSAVVSRRFDSMESNPYLVVSKRRQTDCRSHTLYGDCESDADGPRGSSGADDRSDDANHLTTRCRQRATGVPGFAAASNWIRFVSMCCPSGATYSRWMPEMTPDDSEGPMPNGKPTATASSPACRSAKNAGLPATLRGVFVALITARSCSGLVLTTFASDSEPSGNTTLSCLLSNHMKLVSMVVLQDDCPVPTSHAALFCVSAPSLAARMRTTESAPCRRRVQRWKE